MISVHDLDQEAAFGELTRFRHELYRGLTARADALFELTDAVLCTDGPVRSLVGLSLAPEHRRGHGADYDGINHGRLDIAGLRNLVAAQRLRKAADGRIVLAVDVSRGQHRTAAVVLPYLWARQRSASDGAWLALLRSSQHWRLVEPRGPRCWTRCD